MSAAQSQSALVLRLVAYGDSDRMASLLLDDGSRLEARIAHARSSRRRFGGLDLHVLGRFDLVPDRKGRLRLDSVEIVQPHDGLRADPVRAGLAAHVAELVLAASQEGHPLPDLFRLARAAVAAVSEGKADAAPRSFCRGFELKLLHVLGLRPALRRCASTGDSVSGLPIRWSTRDGGVIGPQAPVDPRSLPLSAATVQALDEALHLPLHEQGSASWSPPLLDEAERATQDFLDAHVGRRRRALDFLGSLLSPGSLAAVLAFAVLPGCVFDGAPESVRLQGWLYPSDAPTLDTPVASAAEASAYDDDGVLLAEGSEPFADSPGWYRFSDLPPERRVHLAFVPVDAPDALGHTTTVVTGRTARDDLFVDAGSFHVLPDAVVGGWAAALELAGAATPILGRGIVAGRARDAVGLSLSLVDALGASVAPVYFDASGAPDAQAIALSADGGFLFPAVEPGPASLHRRDLGDGTGPGGLPLLVLADAVTSLPSLVLAP